MEYQKKNPSLRNGRQWEKGLKRGTKFTDEYKGLSYEQRATKAALIASNNGKAWWVYQYLMTPVYSFEEKPRKDGLQKKENMRTFIRTDD